MPALATVEAGNSQALADALRDHGACLLQNFPPPPATTALRAELLALCDAGALRTAAVGRESSRMQRQDIRGDRTLWLDDSHCGKAAAAHLQALDALRLQLNRSLFLGLRSLEAHYALYPPGTGYARHRDRFRDDDARVVSLVSYLNDSWHASNGGALRLHAADGSVDVLPHGGTTVCFLSEIEHEVLHATRERMSIAAWFRRDEPR